MLNHTESSIKRMQFRKQIREKQIQKRFKDDRMRYLLYNNQFNPQQHSLDFNSQSSFCSINNANNLFQSSNSQMQLTPMQKVKILIFGNQSIDGQIINGQQNKLAVLSNETIRRIWKIVLQADKQQCLNELAIEKLVDIVKAEIDQIYSQSTKKENKVKQNERIGQILWILLNQCYKNPLISLQLTTKIVKLCITILKMSSNKEKQQNEFYFDSYIAGLCIILLGNICVSEGHVQCILNEIKLSKLINIIDKILDINNGEDLSFLISNMLYYYPQKQQAQRLCIHQQVDDQNLDDYCGQCQNNQFCAYSLVQLRQQSLQLLQVLSYLNSKLYSCLLQHLFNISLAQKQNINVSTSKIKSQKKLNYSHLRSDKKYSQKKVVSSQKLSAGQIQHLKLCGMYENSQQPIFVSQNYTHDLMQCVGKIKNMITSIFRRQNNINRNISQHLEQENKSQLIRSQKKAKQIQQIQLKILANLHESQIKIIDLVTRNIYSLNQVEQSDIKQKQNKVSEPSQRLYKERDLFIFYRDIIRSLCNSPNDENQLTQLQNTQRKLNLQLQQHIINTHGKPFLSYVHQYIKQSDLKCINGYQQQIENRYVNKVDKKTQIQVEQIEDDIQNAIWEIYQNILTMLSNPDYQVVNQKSRQNYRKMLLQQMQWLQISLFPKKTFPNQINLSSQSKILQLLSKFFPIITITYQKQIPQHQKQDKFQKSRKSFIVKQVSNQRHENKLFQYVQVDMQKLSGILDILQYKLKQHKQCQTMLIAILRSINTVLQKVRKYILSDPQNSQYSNNLTEQKVKSLSVCKKLLGDSLYQLIYTQLLCKYGDMDEQNSLNTQIHELIIKIFQIQSQEQFQQQNVQILPEQFQQQT